MVYSSDKNSSKKVEEISTESEYLIWLLFETLAIKSNEKFKQQTKSQTEKKSHDENCIHI
jgi:hypothetical protein